MALAETFVVRIYRRGRPGQELLVGTVELVNAEQIRKFGNFEELRAILEDKCFLNVSDMPGRPESGSKK